MRIGYLINEYPKVSHSFVRREIEALERAGVAVEIFSIRPSSAELTDPADVAHSQRTTVLYGRAGDLTGAMRRESMSNGRALSATTAKAMKLARTSEKSAGYWSAYVAEAARLRQLLVERKIDHLHAHFGTNSAAVAMLCRMLGGPSYSFTVHGPEEFDRQTGLSLPAKIEHAAFTVAISSYGRSQLMRLAIAECRDSIHVVRCGLAEEFLAADAPPISSAPNLVTVGRLSEQKGHWVLLDAAKILADQGVDFRLTLVGDGELRSDIEDSIARNDLEDRVVITGWASEAEVRAAIIDSRALVLPSFAEGLPVVIMEALALRRPVLSTYVAGIPELVTPTECGWLVPAGDPNRLEAAMREVLLTQPSQLDELGAVGAERVARMHNVDTEAALLVSLFERAVEGSSTRGMEAEHVAA